MNIINIEHISKVFGEKQVFDDISCGIHQGDKIGIIGINGTGKTTLLKIIAGLEEPDQGQVIFQKGLRVTYLPQSPKFRSMQQFFPMWQTVPMEQTGAERVKQRMR